MSPWRNVSQQCSAEIIEAAASDFAVKGLDGAAMEGIAAVAGINKATIYRDFDCKDALIYAPVGYLLAQELADLQSVLSLPATATPICSPPLANVFSAKKVKCSFDVLLSGPLLYCVYAPDEIDIEQQLCYGLSLFFQGVAVDRLGRH